MNFTSLDDVLSKNFIKSLPHLTRLDLNANEIKLIELVLSFTRKGNQFYMNYADIAEYLHLGDTKTKAKTVGNIVLSVKAKGYIITDTTHNFNGKNGGSSANLKVDEIFLERQLHAFFNPLIEAVAEGQISLISEADTVEVAAASSPKVSTAKSSVDELAELDNQDETCIGYSVLEPAYESPEIIVNDADAMSYKNIETIPKFETMLKRLIRKSSMSSKKSAIQYMIDNQHGWDIDKMKKAFEALVLTNPIK